MAYSKQGDINAAPYLVGNRVYGGGRPFPNIGPSDPMGYRERALRTKARQAAILRRMKTQQTKRYMSSDFLRGNP